MADVRDMIDQARREHIAESNIQAAAECFWARPGLHPSAFIELARSSRQLAPGGVDASNAKMVHENLTLRLPATPPAPPRPAPGERLPPGSIAGWGFGKASQRVNTYHEVYKALAESRRDR